MRLGSIVIMIVMGAVPALAQSPPIQLDLDECSTYASSTRNQVDACNSNSGVALHVVASFVAPMDISDLTGITAELRAVPGTALEISDWWSLQQGGCRSNLASLDIVVQEASPCADPWSGDVFRDVFFTEVPHDPYPSEGFPQGVPGYLRMDVEVSATQPVSLQAGTRYQAFTLSILRGRTSTCSGCCDGACVFLSRILLHRANGSRVWLVPGGISYDDFRASVVFWQNSDYYLHGGCGGYPGCPVPTARATWGELKALYR